jgi:hypothetical protein
VNERFCPVENGLLLGTEGLLPADSVCFLFAPLPLTFAPFFLFLQLVHLLLGKQISGRNVSTKWQS